MLRPIKIVDFGDVHMCHSTTPTEKIGEEIVNCFPYGKWASSIDILSLHGDFWDKLMPNNHPDVYTTEQIIYYLLNWCKHHDIVFLIVDGTPLHDAGQMQKFVHINEHAKINADLIFVEDIAIRYIPKFDINVLFIPDRPRSHPDETYKTVLSIMDKQNITSVDLAIMHGCFQYQMPKIAPEHKHIEDNYLSIVKGPILIGHIHNHSSYERIIAPGSFSRLRHGEEEPKGYVEVILQPSGDFKAKFIENKEATIYKTIRLSNIDIEESLEKIDRVITNIPIHSRIRLECQQGHPLLADKELTALKMKYLGNCIHWSFLVSTDKSVVAEDEEVFKEETDYIPLVINDKNITELVIEKVSSHSDTKIIKLAQSLMESLVEELR